MTPLPTEVPPARRDAQPRAIARSVLTSTTAQIGARGVHLVLNLALTLALIRYFGPVHYGDYVFVITVTMLFGLIADFGLPKLAVRDIVRDDPAAPAVIGTVMAVRLGLSVLAALGVQATISILGGTPELRMAAALVSVLFFAESALTVVVIFHVRLRQEYEAFIRVAMEGTQTAIALWLIARHASLVAIMVGTGAGAGVGVVLAFVLARRRFGLRLAFDIHRVRALVRDAWPVGSALLVGVAYLKLDSVMLAAMRPRIEVGIYGAAYQPVEYLLLSSPVIINVLFPLLARWHGVDARRFGEIYRWGAEGLLGLTLPLAVLTAFFAPALVQRFYLPSYAPAAQPLRILMAALVLMIINCWQSFVLLAGNRQKVTLKYDAAALGLNVMLNLFMVWRYGYLGAAITALLTAAFVTRCSTSATRMLLGASLDGRQIRRILLANALMGATAWGALAGHLAWWAAALLTCASYPVWVQLCRVVSIRRLIAARRALQVPSLHKGAEVLAAVAPQSTLLVAKEA